MIAISCRIVHATWTVTSAIWPAMRMMTPVMSATTSMSGSMGKKPINDWPLRAWRRRACDVASTNAVLLLMALALSASEMCSFAAYSAWMAHHSALFGVPSQTWPWNVVGSLMMPPYCRPVNTRLTTSKLVKITGCTMWIANRFAAGMSAVTRSFAAL